MRSVAQWITILTIPLFALTVSCAHRAPIRNSYAPMPKVDAQRAAHEPETQPRATEAETKRESLEWFNKRHRDGGLRAKALAQLEQASGPAATTGTWTSIGPQPINDVGFMLSGRVWGIAIDPTINNTIYIGTEGGGVWKSTNSGFTWSPLTDAQPNINIRDLALAPTSSSHIYAATLGGGLLFSPDGGTTWSTQTPDSNYDIYSVSVSPTNASSILAATANSIVSSADGGNTWNTTLSGVYAQQVLFDPSNGSIAYATASDKGLYRSTDSGATWSLLPGSGLPTPPYARLEGGIDLAIAPSSSNILYLALKSYTSNLTLGFYKSIDSGNTWAQIAAPPAIDDASYWGWSMRVHPSNPNIILAGCLGLNRSTDGGNTWVDLNSGIHVDHHVQTFTPDGNTLYDGGDGGIYVNASPIASTVTWTSLNNTLSTALFYPGISIHPSDLNLAYGGTQDNGILRYQSSLSWNELNVCGDGGFTALDFVNTQNLYATCQNISVNASNDGGNTFHSATNGIALTDPSDFIAPLVMDPSNSQRLYFGTYRLYQTTNGANSWTAISGDLTAGACCIDAIGIAPSNPNVVYTGAFDVVFVTQNALSGASAMWSQCSTLSGSLITQIAVSPTNSQVAWITLGYGGVLHTTDGCKTWVPAGTGLPNIAADDIVIDPDIANTVYVATDVGVYRSVDSGQSWVPLGSGLPHVIVHALKLHEATRTLRAATYGRGMWDIAVPVTDSVPFAIQSTTPGRYFSLEDGSVFQTPTTFYWQTGTQHTVAWLSNTAGVPGARFSFNQWTDAIRRTLVPLWFHLPASLIRPRLLRSTY